MPIEDIVKWILGAATLATALGVLWKKVLLPGAQTTTLSAALLEQLRAVPNSPDLLRRMMEEFKTDSGKSLRDVADRIEAAAKLAAQASEDLKSSREAARLLAVEERQQIDRLVAKVDRLIKQLSRNPQRP